MSSEKTIKLTKQKRSITWAQAFAMMKQYGIAEWSENDVDDYSDGFCVLENGWKIQFSINVQGPYSEVTPDIDADLIITLQET